MAAAVYYRMPPYSPTATVAVFRAISFCPTLFLPLLPPPPPLLLHLPLPCLLRPSTVITSPSSRLLLTLPFKVAPCIMCPRVYSTRRICATVRWQHHS